MPGDTLFLEVDAKGDEVETLLAIPGHEQPAWMQCWRNAKEKATTSTSPPAPPHPHHHHHLANTSPPPPPPPPHHHRLHLTTTTSPPPPHHLFKALPKLVRWKDKEDKWQDKMSMKEAIAASSDAYPVKVKKVKHVVPSDDTRRLRELQGA